MAPSRTAIFAILSTVLTALLPGCAGAQVPEAEQEVEVEVEVDREAYVRDFVAANREAGLVVPDFGADMEWLNTRRPLSLLEDLKGKVVLLDFWTYCCINCHHVLPDLEYLERTFAHEPFEVIGVHSAKFANEGQKENIRQAVLRHGIRHPVVNDDDFAVWRSLGVKSWPTLLLLGPDGVVLAALSGEGHRETLELLVNEALDQYRDTGLLGREPLPLRLESDGVPPQQLAFPGKLASDGRDRLFIADTAHDRIVVTDLDGRFQEVWGGVRGLQDGAVDEVRFNQPQGLLLHEGVLYVADTENHAVRAVDLATRKVRTVAGTGEQGSAREGGGFSPMTALSSPWDLVWHEGLIYIAMAGTHQIWALDPQLHKVVAWAGDGTERRLDAARKAEAAFAQPSGLATDGKRLYIADSESSSIRSVSLKSGRVDTHAGATTDPRNLFAFGDIDGAGFEARLQHPLGMAWHKGKVYFADTYNHRIKVLEPESGVVTTLAGTGTAGRVDGRFDQAQFYEPGDIEVVGNRLYVADTNNHAVRVIDLGKSRVSTLDLSTVPVPKPLPEEPWQVPVYDSARRLDGTPISLAEGRGTIRVELTLPAGRKLAPSAPSAVQVVPLSGVEAVDGSLVELVGTTAEVPVQVSAEGAVEVRGIVYHCAEDKDCQIDNVVVKVPVHVGAGSAVVRLPL